MGYRFSDEFIQRWTKRLVWSLCIGIGLAFLLAGGALLLHEAMGVAEGSTLELILLVVAIAGMAIGVVAVVGCLWVASVLGGLSLHPRGWIPGVLLPAWLFLGPLLLFALDLDGGTWTLAYLAGFVPVIALFWWIGAKAKVPMYLRSPAPHSPRLYVTEGEGDFTGSGHEMDRDRGDLHVDDLKDVLSKPADPEPSTPSTPPTRPEPDSRP